MSTELIAALTALAAVVFGPLVSIYVARREIRASLVSGNRQVWINRLREELAHFIREVRLVPSALAADAITAKDAIGRYEDIALREETVRLLLNPAESDHMELLRLMKAAREMTLAAVNSRRGMADKLNEAADLVVSSSQRILKAEWERVKRGD